MPKTSIAALFCLLALSLAPPAWAAPPTFDNYPMLPVYHGKPAPVKLASHPKARMFRTRLQEGNRGPANFAGHYKLITFGCGTSCQSSFIVDTLSGNVYGGPTASADFDFHPESQLLIVNPPAMLKEIYGATPPDWAQTHYYLWQNNRLENVPTSP